MNIKEPLRPRRPRFCLPGQRASDGPGLRAGVTGLLAALLLLAATPPALAVVIFLKGEDQPIRGYLVRQSERSVELREVLADGRERSRTIPRSAIDELLITVSPERLAALSPDDPDAYREYAEELAEKWRDPEARQTALRLYLIAAHLAPARLGRSCLLGMIPLARSEAEQRRFRAMAYLLDPAHDPRVLTHPPQARRPQSSLDRQTAEALIRALRLARQGERRNALTQARRFRLDERLPELTDTITVREFEEACEPGKQVSPSLARRILELELAWLPSGAGEAPQADSTTLPLPSGWSRAVAAQGVDPVRPLSLEKLTDMDPRASRYRDGEWTTP